MLSDSVPDKFGNAVIRAWLKAQGRLPESLTPIERLCYTGVRGMGALEYKPTMFDDEDKSSGSSGAWRSTCWRGTATTT